MSQHSTDLLPTSQDGTQPESQLERLTIEDEDVTGAIAYSSELPELSEMNVAQLDKMFDATSQKSSSTRKTSLSRSVTLYVKTY